MNERVLLSRYDKLSPARSSEKVAMVCNSSWYTYNFRLGLLLRLKEMGLQLYIIAPHDHYSTKLMALGFHFIPLPNAMYNTNPFQELSLLRFLNKVYKRERFDFIIHYTAKPNIYGSIAAFWNRIPAIAVTTGLGLLRDEKKKLAARILKSMYRLASLLTKELWFLNEDDRHYFLKNRMIQARKTFVLPSEGVNIDWYRPNPSRSRSSREKLRFLYAGRIVWSKGIGEFYQAAKYFKENKLSGEFHIVGFIVPDHPDGVAHGTVQEWHKQGVVKYHGESEDIRPFIQEADCIVLPSYFGEGVPRILLEAASMGKVIITTNFVGCKEVVEDRKNGFLCRPKDSEDLINKLLIFAASTDRERELMGLAGRRKVLEEFDEEIIIEHYLSAVRRYLPLLSKSNKIRSLI